jgi:hypothetical protein
MTRRSSCGADGWADDVRALAARGIRVALPHRPEGRRDLARGATRGGCGSSSDDAAGGLPSASRSIGRGSCPGMSACGCALLPWRGGDAADAAVRALRAAAMQGGVLSVHVEVLALRWRAEGRRRRRSGARGFARFIRPRRYPRTVVVDLARDSSAILASFHPTARRHIRAAQRGPLRIAPITDEAFAPRLEELARESFRRRSAVPGPRDWRALVAARRERPDLARVVGSFGTVTRIPMAAAGLRRRAPPWGSRGVRLGWLDAAQRRATGPWDTRWPGTSWSGREIAGGAVVRLRRRDRGAVTAIRG